MAHELTTEDSGDLVVIGKDGSTLSSLTQRFGHVVNVKDDYDAVGDDAVTDDTAAFQAAIDAADAVNGAVFIPPSRYLITATLNYKVPMFGVTGVIDSRTTLKSTINDDTPIIKIDNLANWFLHGFSLDGDNLNVTGILATAHCSLGTMREMRIRRCDGTAGIDFTGFSNRFHSVHVVQCELGMKLAVMNASDLEIYCGANDVGMIWVSGSGSRLRGLIEGNTTAGLLINATENLDVSCWFESSGIDVHVGDTGGSLANNVFLKGNFSSGGLVIVERAEDFKMSSTDSNTGTVEVRSGALGAQIPTHERLIQGGLRSQLSIAQEAAHTNVPAKNFLVNPNFIGGARGYVTAPETQNVSVSEETTITRDAPTALRVDLTDGTIDNAFYILLPDSIVTYWAGRTIWAGAWVWVPNITNFANKTLEPAVTMEIAEDGGNRTRSGSKPQTLVVDSWNLIVSSRTVSGSAVLTEPTIGLYGNRSAVEATTGDFVVFSGAFICVDCDLEQMTMGRFTPHESAGQIINGQVVASHSAAPTSSDIAWEVGDRVFNTAPAAGGVPGWVCTTAGSPGTWKAMAALAA